MSTIIAATAHTLSGGVAPVWLVLTATALAAPAAVWLVGRRPSPLRTATVVLVSQAMFHTFFSVTAGTDPTLSHSHVHGLAPAVLGPVSTPQAHAASVSMVAAHVLAAVVTTAALVYGERLLGAARRGIRRLLARVDHRTLAPLRPAPRTSWAAPHATPLIAMSSLSRRGPPISLRDRTAVI